MSNDDNYNDDDDGDDVPHLPQQTQRIKIEKVERSGDSSRRVTFKKDVASTMNEGSVLACVVTPVRNEKLLGILRQMRQLNSFRFVPVVVRLQPTRAELETMRKLETWAKTWSPLDIWRACTERDINPLVSLRFQRHIREYIELYQRGRRPEKGYIYVFHDLADDADIVKIGKTTQTPEERIKQWEAVLSPEPGRNIRILCAYPTSDASLAELVIHSVMFCERITNRINPQTSSQLVEFYRYHNLMALKKFIAKALIYVDQFVAAHRVPARDLSLEKRLKNIL